MNQKLGRKRRQRESSKSDLHFWVHDSGKTRALKEETRYAFAILANIFHDVMLLNRLIARSDPKAGPDHVKAAQITQAMLLIRMLGGKLWEARLRLNDEVMHRQLTEEFFPLVEGSASQWKELSRTIRKAEWLATLRNNHAFHYPTFAQIGGPLTQLWMREGGTIFGNAQGNTLFNEGGPSTKYGLSGDNEAGQEFDGH